MSDRQRASSGASGETSASLSPDFVQLDQSTFFGLKSESSSFAPLGYTPRHKITPEQLEGMLPLVRALSADYGIPEPELGYCQLFCQGAYDNISHSIQVALNLSVENLPSMIHHEMNHAGQFKSIAAAKIVYPERFREIEVHESLTRRALEEGRDQDPLYVSVGVMFASSCLQVIRAQNRAGTTDDDHEYLAMRRVYEDSFFELTPEISRYEYEIFQARTSAEDRLESARLLREQKCGFFRGVFNHWKAGRLERQAGVLEESGQGMAVLLGEKIEILKEKFLRSEREGKVSDGLRGEVREEAERIRVLVLEGWGADM